MTSEEIKIALLTIAADVANVKTEERIIAIADAFYKYVKDDSINEKPTTNITEVVSVPVSIETIVSDYARNDKPFIGFDLLGRIPAEPSATKSTTKKTGRVKSSPVQSRKWYSDNEITTIATLLQSKTVREVADIVERTPKAIWAAISSGKLQKHGIITAADLPTKKSNTNKV